MTPSQSNSTKLAKITRAAQVLALSNTNTDECVLWPYYRNLNPRDGKPSYGQIHLKGKTMLTSRAAWILNGRHVDPKEDICHFCDNPGCVNLRHLFVGTRKENMEDCRRKGRNFIPSGMQHPKVKLTEKQVREIRSLYPPEARKIDWTSLFQRCEGVVSKRAIRSVVRRETWKHLL